jgi:S-adenosylmethionine hydrolase
MHTVRPQAVREAAFMLFNTYRYFPRGTVFLVVVDPGVGSTRRAIAVSDGDFSFVAPDNGVLSYVLAELEEVQAVSLTKPDYQLQPVSHTFHGRDIFAPAAAHLAAGARLSDLGDPVTDLQQLDLPLFRVLEDHLVGEVLHVDHFGNVISSLGEFAFAGPNTLRLSARFTELPEPRYFTGDRLSLKVGGQTLRGVHQSYSEHDPGSLLMLIDSNGFLEIAMKQGSAAAVLGLQVGDRIEVKTQCSSS